MTDYTAHCVTASQALEAVKVSPYRLRTDFVSSALIVEIPEDFGPVDVRTKLVDAIAAAMGWTVARRTYVPGAFRWETSNPESTVVFRTLVRASKGSAASDSSCGRGQ